MLSISFSHIHCHLRIPPTEIHRTLIDIFPVHKSVTWVERQQSRDSQSQRCTVTLVLCCFRHLYNNSMLNASTGKQIDQSHLVLRPAPSWMELLVLSLPCTLTVPRPPVGRNFGNFEVVGSQYWCFARLCLYLHPAAQLFWLFPGLQGRVKKALSVLMLSSALLGRPRCGLSIWLSQLAIRDPLFWVYVNSFSRENRQNTKILEVLHVNCKEQTLASKKYNTRASDQYFIC